MIRKLNKTKFCPRYTFLVLGISFLFFGLVYRLICLQVFQRDFLQKQGDRRTIRLVNINANRGLILDRNGEPLAVSTPVKSIWANPKEVDLDNLNKLANLIGLSKFSIKKKLTKYQNKEFVYIRRHLPPEIADNIAELNLPGIYLKSEYKRYYPHGEISAHVVGFTDIDQRGQEGLELAYNDWLRGIDGKKRIIKDRLGREIKNIGDIKAPLNGRELVLSLDQRLQYLVYRELKYAISKHKAVSGSAVVVSIDTGEVLAMVNLPSYNPNDRNKKFVRSNLRNRAVTDFFEPASSIKAFSIASVFENCKVTPETIVDTSPGIMKFKGGVVRDDKNNGKIDVLTILKRSSNVGMSKLIQKLPSPYSLFDTYNRLGFGSRTESGFPGESIGLLSHKNTEHPFVLATMSFGYGLAVTPLQLARAYATLGANGVRRPISFIKLETPPSGVKVISTKVSRQVIETLSAVASQKMSRAQVNGYHVAGKTGTARKLGKEGYITGKHRAVYGGIAPAINPKFSIVVTINEPNSGEYYGNLVAAPVFSRIAQGAFRLYRIQPDLLETQGVFVASSADNRS